MQIYCQFSVSGDENEKAKIAAFGEAFTETLKKFKVSGVKAEASATTTKTTDDGEDDETPAPKRRGRPPSKKTAPKEDTDVHEDDTGEYEDEAPKKKTEKKAAKKSAARDDSEDDSDDENEEDQSGDDSDSDDDDNVDDADTDSDDGDEAPKLFKKGKKLTLDGDIIPACAKYSQKYDRPAVLKILKSFGVKSVRELDEDDFPKVLEALKKAPGKKG